MVPAAPEAAAVALDLSIIGLFLQAGLFVKGIMLLLFTLSVMTWAIWFAKGRQFKALTKKANALENSFWSSRKSAENFVRDTDKSTINHPMGHVLQAAVQEWEDGDSKSDAQLHRIRRMVDATMTRELEALESWLPFLATVGSTGPFVGLLGTVWGVMTSFQSIGAAKSTSLAVVAPGIAEALLATALGLFAAIPAVVAYNRLASAMGRYAGRVEAFTAEFISLLERRAEKLQDKDAE